MGVKTRAQLAAEIASGVIPNLSPILARDFIDRAWADIRESREWSFLNTMGILHAPAAITSGSASVTKNSATVTLDATAAAALANLTFPVITKRQIRFSGGTIYGISNLVGTTLTLDRIYREATNSAATYSCFRAYFGLPEDSTGTEVTDFMRYSDIYCPALNYYFYDVNLPIKKLDIIDPQRVISGLPVVLCARGVDSNNNPIYEMSPFTTAEMVFHAQYQKRGTDMTDTDVAPKVIPDQLILTKALSYACQWAAGKVAQFPELRGTNWLLLKQSYDLTYSNPRANALGIGDIGLLERTQRQDEELCNQMELTTIKNYIYPNDPAWGYYNIAYQ